MRGPGCPFKGLEIAVAKARATHQTSLLAHIYFAEIGRLIDRELKAKVPMVAFDEENPSFIIGWGHPAFRYVKVAFRGRGIGRALRNACGS